jgi:hypothetical protein
MSSFEYQSKTAVLEKTIAYLHELRSQNLALVKQTVDAGIILHENDALRDRVRLKYLLVNGSSLLLDHLDPSHGAREWTLEIFTRQRKSSR